MLDATDNQMTTLISSRAETDSPNKMGVDWDICQYFITQGTWAAYISSFLVIIGLAANTLLIYTVFRSVVLRGVSSNALIASVGFGNILLLLISAPAFIKHEFNLCWQLGISACKFYAFSEVFAISAIAFSILAISYERIRTARGGKPLDSKLRGIILVCIWGCAFVIAIPTAGLADLAYDSFCRVRPHFEPRGRAYIISQLLLVYLLPSVLNFVLRLWAVFVKSGYDNTQDAPHHTPKEFNIATLVITFTTIIAWLPFYVFALGLEFQSLPFENRHLIMNLYDAQFVLLYLNATLCPFMLWAFSGMHREAMLEEACCGGQCLERCGRAPVGDRYSAFRNEFDLGGDNINDEMPVVGNEEDDEDDHEPNHV
ncbi:phe13-bombesin receptor-like [Amphiura filiformis]|uniref:phe13-bombesin receptor-like n=1 Tax=Amphiura filiformis TaxID=82378 RepID=UPI003B220CBA